MSEATRLRPASRGWVESLPDWPARAGASRSCLVGVLAGEGIGPEVVGAALRVLEAAARETDLELELRRADDVPPTGRLDDACADFCGSIFAAGGALLCGARGGRFVYELRERFDLFCKLVPLRPAPALADAAIVRPDLLDGVDVLIVRENLGGVYLGDSGRGEDGRVAWQHFAYRADQVARIAGVAADLARRRSGRLAVVVKRGGVPEVSALWIEEAQSAADAQGVALEVLDVDNASFQIVARPRSFDVVVAPNMIGDVLADGAAVLLGSRGMSWSANFGPAGRAVYQTGHGAAHDLAGTNRANPVAQILSAAAMLRESFGRVGTALRIESAVERVLAAGIRTPDVAGPESRVVGTRELAECVADEVAKLPPAAESAA